MSHASDLVDRVIAMHAPGDTLNFATDAEGIPGRVLLAIWLPVAAFVMAIDAKEWDALKCARIFGFSEAEKQSAIERAISIGGKSNVATKG